MQETYDDVPEWYRPSSLQRSTPHPVCIDLVAWPQLRDLLVQKMHQIDAEALSRDISDCITIDWPENQQLFVQDLRTNQPILNPSFEAHVWEYSNWKMRKAWSWKQPQMRRLVGVPVLD